MSIGYVPAMLPPSGDDNAAWWIHACGFIANGRLNQPPTANPSLPQGGETCIVCGGDLRDAAGWSLLYRQVKWTNGDPNLPLAERVHRAFQVVNDLIAEAHAEGISCPVRNCGTCWNRR